jgi:hypothetical protein
VADVQQLDIHRQDRKYLREAPQTHRRRYPAPKMDAFSLQVLEPPQNRGGTHAPIIRRRTGVSNVDRLEWEVVHVSWDQVISQIGRGTD